MRREKRWERLERCKGRRPLQSPQGRAALNGHCETMFRTCIKLLSAAKNTWRLLYEKSNGKNKKQV